MSSKATMRAVDVRDTGSGKVPASAMWINPDTPKPKPTGTQALVRIRAFGLNRMDLMQREGNYPLPPQAPKTMGVEFVGRIEELGSSAGEKGEDFKVGDEVFGLAYGGAYAEYIVVSTHMLIHKPTELSNEECAGIPETWITALQALYFIAEFTDGCDKTVLWHAGASAVSIAGIQLSLAGGASAVYATARQDSKLKFCVDELGCKAAFNSETSDWPQEVLKATDGKGVDIIVDFIGGPAFQANLTALARDGRMVNLAAMGGTKIPAGADMGLFFRKRLRVEGSGLRSRDELYQGKLRDLLVEHALPRFKDGRFKVHIERVMDWEKIVEAHELMETNATKGKIICTINW